MPDMIPLWCVLNPGRKQFPPKKGYEKAAEAMKDAESLSHKHPGKPIYVMQAIGKFEQPLPQGKTPEQAEAEVAAAEAVKAE